MVMNEVTSRDGKVLLMDRFDERKAAEFIYDSIT
jgi:hypothetical protein